MASRSSTTHFYGQASPVQVDRRQDLSDINSTQSLRAPAPTGPLEAADGSRERGLDRFEFVTDDSVMLRQEPLSTLGYDGIVSRTEASLVLANDSKTAVDAVAGA